MLAGARLSGITVDCRAPARLAEFWSELLGRSPVEALPGWVRLAGDPVLNFQPVTEPKQGKVRLHLDVAVPDIDAAIAFVTARGARTVDRHDYDEGVVIVAADPEDNEFCLVQYY